MKILCIQFLPENNSATSKEEIVHILESAGFKPKIEEEKNNGAYVNFIIETNSLKETWEIISKILISTPRYAMSTIVVCEGSKSWDNYLLLHHHDTSENLDKL